MTDFAVPDPNSDGWAHAFDVALRQVAVALDRKTIVNVHDPIVGVPTSCPQMIATLDTCRDMLEHWAED